MDACEGVEDFCTQLFCSFDFSSSDCSIELDGHAVTGGEKLGGRGSSTMDGQFEDVHLPSLDSAWSPEPTPSLDAMHEDHHTHSPHLSPASAFSLQSNGSGGPNPSSPVDAAVRFKAGRDTFFDCGETVDVDGSDWQMAAEDWPSPDLNALSEFLDALPEIPVGSDGMEQLAVAMEPRAEAVGIGAPHGAPFSTQAFSSAIPLTLVQSADVTSADNLSAGIARPSGAATTAAGILGEHSLPPSATQAPAAPPTSMPTHRSSVMPPSVGTIHHCSSVASQSHALSNSHAVAVSPSVPPPCPLPLPHSHEAEPPRLPSLLPPPSAAHALIAAATAAVAAASASAAARSSAQAAGNNSGQKQQPPEGPIGSHDGSASKTRHKCGEKQNPQAQSLPTGDISAGIGAVRSGLTVAARDGNDEKWRGERGGGRAKLEAGAHGAAVRAKRTGEREASEREDDNGSVDVYDWTEKILKQHQEESGLSSPEADVAPWESSTDAVVEAVAGAAAGGTPAPWPAVLPGAVAPSAPPVASEADKHPHAPLMACFGNHSDGGATAGCPSAPASVSTAAAAPLPAAAAAAAPLPVASAAAGGGGGGTSGCNGAAAQAPSASHSRSSRSSSRRASSVEKEGSSRRRRAEIQSKRATRGRQGREYFNDVLLAEENEGGGSGSEESEQQREEEALQEGQQHFDRPNQQEQQQEQQLEQEQLEWQHQQHQQYEQGLLRASQGEEDEPGAQKRELRLQRNRQSALLSRQRRKSYVSELEGKCSSLMSAVTHLRQALAVTAMENGALRDQLMRLQAAGILPAAGAAPGSVFVSALGGGSNGSASAPGTAAVDAATSLPPPSSPSQVSWQSDDQEVAGDTMEIARGEGSRRKRGLKRIETDMEERAEMAMENASGGNQRSGKCESGTKKRKASAAAVAAAGATMSSVVAEPAALESDSLPSESLPWPSTSASTRSSFSSSVAFLLLILTLTLAILLMEPSPVHLILPALCSILLFRACLLPSLPLLSAWQHGLCLRSPSLPQSLHQLVGRSERLQSRGNEGCRKLQNVLIVWSRVLAAHRKRVASRKVVYQTNQHQQEFQRSWNYVARFALLCA